MKSEINGVIYNTDSATTLGGYWNELLDEKSCTEELYRTEDGEYFLYAEGGPESIYGKTILESEGIILTGAQEIIPLSEEDAKEWAEKSLTVDEYEEAFGEVAE